MYNFNPGTCENPESNGQANQHQSVQTNTIIQSLYHQSLQTTTLHQKPKNHEKTCSPLAKHSQSKNVVFSEDLFLMLAILTVYQVTFVRM